MQPAFAATAVHVPAVAGLTLHDMQSFVPPAHGVEQHTVSTHVSPPWHIAVRAHVPPPPSKGWHWPVGMSQYWPGHCESVLHDPRQTAPLHG